MQQNIGYIYLSFSLKNLEKAIKLIKNAFGDALYFTKNKKTNYFDLIASMVLNGYSLVGMIVSLSYSSKEFASQLLLKKQ